MNDRGDTAGDKAGFQGHDIAAAFSLLTRLPVPVDHARAGSRAAVASWAYPLVGAALGAMVAVLTNIMLAIGLPAGIAAAMVLGLLALGTGAMHEDGLADTADGLVGGQDIAGRLLIMKDSRIGAFGAVALGIFLLARWSGVEALILGGQLFWPMVAIGAVSRLPMVLVMFFVAPARKDGLSAGVGLPPPPSIAVAVGITLVVCLLALGWTAFPVIFWALIVPVPLLILAQKKIGGQTGDILGACQQMAEVAALAVCVASLG